jgi:hypothetical protein
MKASKKVATKADLKKMKADDKKQDKTDAMKMIKKVQKMKGKK